MMREKILLNQGTVTVEVHTQLRNAFRNTFVKYLSNWSKPIGYGISETEDELKLENQE